MRKPNPNPDILIKNGRVVDGTGNPAYYADISIVGDKIDFIGRIDEVEAALTIDAAGKVITPGLLTNTLTLIRRSGPTQKPKAVFARESRRKS